MATHNQVRLVGYVKGNVKVVGEAESEKAFLTLRTVHRDIDLYYEEPFEDILIFYDNSDEKLMNKIKKLEPFDIVDIKGVFNILPMNKTSICPACGEKNVKHYASTTFVYPLHIMKLNALYTAYEHDKNLPEELLIKHYKEISNQAIICGTVVKEPELRKIKKGYSCCRYPLGVNRKYYIKTQGELTADYPWIYTFGQQAEDDAKHLLKGSTVLMDGFIRTRRVETQMMCEVCGTEYTYPDTATEFIPYSLEYLKDYLTDEDIAKIEEERKQEAYRAAQNKIFEN